MEFCSGKTLRELIDEEDWQNLDIKIKMMYVS